MRDFLLGPSAALSNGNIVDGRIWWRCPVREVEKFQESAEESDQGCSDLGCRLPSWENSLRKDIITAENFGALMISYSEIGGHVLTPFLDTCPGLVECR